MATINGTAGNDRLSGTAGNDTINALGGDDIVLGGSGGADVIDGGTGRDSIEFREAATSALVVDFVAGTITGGGSGSISFTNIERLVAGNFNDSLTGNAAAQSLGGQVGADTLWGAGGIDTLWGGSGADTFIFRETGTANADSINDWASGSDKLLLDGAVMTALGAAGNFAAGDARFWSSSTGTAHDADDRVIYNTTTRQIFYDADGNGSGAAVLIATLQSGATLAATDIAVEGGSGGGQTINGTAGNDTLEGGAGNDTINGLAGNDLIHGRDGADSLIGGDGTDTLVGGSFTNLQFDSQPDTLDGGLGDDRFVVNAGDVILPDAGGVDQVNAWNTSWTLGAGLENLNIVNNAGGTHLTGTGNALDNRIEAIDNGVTPSSGSSLFGMGGNDLVISNWNVVTDAHGGDGNDTVYGGQNDDQLFGDAGNDQLIGRAGANALTGGTGADNFIFDDNDGTADAITDFSSGVDKIRFDGRVFTQLGATGNFAAGDARFRAGTAAQDADDRIIFDASTGNLWYDADGNGGGAAQLVAQVSGSVVAADIAVDNGTGAQTINGTPGNDTLVGGDSSDTINGFGGDDSLVGGQGADSLSGGDGNDTLDGVSHRHGDGDPDIDTLDGGLGNDVFRIDHPADVFSDAGGVDTIVAYDMDWTLAAGFEHLTLRNDESESGFTGIGNGLNNRIEATWAGSRLEGRDGDDTLIGASGQGASNQLFGGTGNDSLVSGGLSDRLDGGTGVDTLTGAGADVGHGEDFVFSTAPGAANADVIVNFDVVVSRIVLDGNAMSQIGPSGTFAADDDRFHAAAGASGGHDADDRVVYNTSTGQLFYDADGSGSAAAQLLATLQGAPELTASRIVVENGTPGQASNGTSGNDSLVGSDGGDTMNGLEGDDTLLGLAGDDVIDAGPGNDRVEGGLGRDNISPGPGNDTVSSGRGNDFITDGGGSDLYVFDVAPGAANSDTMRGFQSGADKIVLKLEVFTAVGPAGNFSANDGRFYAASLPWEGVNGHDADDRIVYNTNNGDLWYDADGSGAGAALLIANLRSDVLFGGGGDPSSLTASDIFVEGGSSGGGGSGTVITGTSGNDRLSGTAGNDTINALGGDDIVVGGSGGADVIDGGTGRDSIEFREAATSALVVDFVAGTITGGGSGSISFTSIERVVAGNFNDILTGNAASQSLGGQVGSDTLWGAGGIDTLWGGAGADTFIFRETGSANADQISDWTSGSDKLLLDGAVMTALGAAGNFAAGDARFWSSSTGTAHDADDRILYNTTTRQIFYDADGNGSGAAVLIATLQGGATLAATDIVVEGSTPPSGGQVINGTSGNDSLVGGAGNDTINGLGGNDTLDGAGGNDRLDGGSGNDSLFGSEGGDTFIGGDGDDTLNGNFHRFNEEEPAIDVLDGGLGNDLFLVDNAADVISDAGGVDTVRAINIGWTLAAGFENLILNNDELESRVDGIGNELNNVLGTADGSGWFVYFEGRGGSDTIFGSPQDDTLLGGEGDDSIDGGEDHDIIDGGAGNDTLFGGVDWEHGDTLTGGIGADVFVPGNPEMLEVSIADQITDFASGADKVQLDGNEFANTGPSGNFSAGDSRFVANSTGTAQDASDRVVYNTSSGQLWYDADGSAAGARQLIATLQGAPTLVATDIEVINGSAGGGGGQVINGTAGNDRLSGTAGNDTINALGGDDIVVGGSGGADVIDGGAGRDSIEFREAATSALVVDFRAGTVTGGSSGSTSFTSIERLVAGNFNDSLTGNATAQSLGGQVGADTLWGAGGIDTLWGGSGADTFIFREMGTANADRVGDWASGSDKLALDDAAFTAIGAAGGFVAGDARFWSSSAGTAHDANDRVIFNTSTGSLYYDADGNGSGAPQLIATVQSGASVLATDIVVI